MDNQAVQFATAFLDRLDRIARAVERMIVIQGQLQILLVNALKPPLNGQQHDEQIEPAVRASRPGKRAQV